MSKTYIDKETGWIIYEMPKPCDAKYLIVAAEGGKIVEINYFGSFKDAKQVFDEIANDHGCEPETVNKSGYYDVSIWRWTENRYEKIYYYE
ncbi:MAG: hypothetical protein C4538_03530 [Nitrospiraceae bacterium]|nr:MAG: hypothetical protein C4538_03530 [Nitrospiraceae bacterium]